MCTQHAHEQRMKRVHVTTLAVVQRGAAEHANASMRHAMLWGLLHAATRQRSQKYPWILKGPAGPAPACSWTKRSVSHRSKTITLDSTILLCRRHHTHAHVLSAGAAHVTLQSRQEVGCLNLRASSVASSLLRVWEPAEQHFSRAAPPGNSSPGLVHLETRSC